VLAPGASAGRDQPALVAIDKVATAMGAAVRRIDFPYWVAGRRAPDRPAVLISTIVGEASSLCAEAGLPPERVFLGGRSMGGRMCSMAVAEGLPAAGLVLVSYPLHPPGKPERPRTEHFSRLVVPCLFVSGTRDAFGSPEELQNALRSISGPVQVDVVEGADHGMKGREKMVAEAVGQWLTTELRRGELGAR
jgi:predicted alpha/beta-hydrolase family hydrolase